MSEIRGLDAWMRVLNEHDLPTLNSVVKEICELSDNEKCRAEDLTKIILRDANLTSQVLKIANSVHYNTTFIHIKTVSRAIVQLGFENLKNITLAATLIDSFLKDKPKQRMIQSLARSFHAAVQAKAMMPHLDSQHKEQVFIAALLRNLSELALITTARPVVEDFLDARDKEPRAEHRLAQEYLGVDTQVLTRSLIKDWSLGDILAEACDNRSGSSPAAKAVNLGNELSKYIHLGTKSPEMRKLYEQMASLCKIKVEEAKQQVLLMADEASVIAKTYGVDVLISALPDTHAIEEQENAQPIAKSDYVFQQMLNNIHNAMMTGDDISKITQLSVAALYEGADIPRTAIALIDYKTKSLDIRYVAGKGTHLWRQQIHINLEHLRKGELLHALLLTQKNLWHQPKVAPKDIGVLRVFGVSGDIFLAPLVLNKRMVALVYADAIDQALSARQYEEFQLITNQLNLMMRINANATA